MRKRKNIYKTASWLAVSGVLITATAWWESGSLTVGLLAATWACLLKTPIYWVHEHVWESQQPKSQPVPVLCPIVTVC